MLALALSLVLSQTIYEWVDSKGETHFTDDPSTIPGKVKPKVTVMAVSDAGASTVKVLSPSEPARPEGPDKCAAARLRVANLEELIATTKRDAETAQRQRAEACQAHLVVNDRARFATCIAAAQASVEGNGEALERQLASARETLRRVQVAGCR